MRSKFFNVFQNFLRIKIIHVISYECNCRCDYCMNHGIESYSDYAPIEDCIKFYNRLFSEAPSNLNVDFTITGGEPFHPNCVENTLKLVRSMINKPFIDRIRINTNGYYEIPEELNSPKILIQFSLDGNEEYCDKISHKPGLYKNVMKNIDFCHEKGYWYQTRTVITDENIDDLPDVVNLALKNKHIAYIQVAKPVGGNKDGSEVNNLMWTIELSKELEEKYSKYSNINIVQPFFGCSNLDPNCLDSIPFLINPKGEIGACAFLSSKFMSKYTIYNLLDTTTLPKYKLYIYKHLKDATCSFPDGVSNFINQLDEESKNKLLGRYRI